eukprot:5784753-Pyramimonas_sp.AAC.1
MLRQIGQAGEQRFAAPPLGSVPQTGTITPIARTDDQWDGGVVLVAATPGQAQAVASRLNGMCIA